MTDTKTHADRVLAALAADESPLRDQGVDALAAFLFGRRVAELVDVAGTVEATTVALTAGNVDRIVREHLSPAWDRHRDRCDAVGERLGDALPDAARAELVELAGATEPPRLAWADGAVDRALVRELLSPVLQSTLVGFARRLPLPGMAGAGGEGGGGGLAGKLVKGVGERAQKLAGVGRSVVGGLSAELDRRIQSAAREFSQEAQKELREQIAERLRSDEGRKITARIREQIVTRILETEVATLMRDVEALPREELERLVGPTIAHAAAREIGKAAIESELRAFLDVEGQKRVGELLDELGVRDEARRVLRGRLDALCRELASDRGFRGFVEAVLAV